MRFVPPDSYATWFQKTFHVHYPSAAVSRQSSNSHEPDNIDEGGCMQSFQKHWASKQRTPYPTDASAPCYIQWYAKLMTNTAPAPVNVDRFVTWIPLLILCPFIIIVWCSKWFVMVIGKTFAKLCFSCDACGSEIQGLVTLLLVGPFLVFVAVLFAGVLLLAVGLSVVDFSARVLSVLVSLFILLWLLLWTLLRCVVRWIVYMCCLSNAETLFLFFNHNNSTYFAISFISLFEDSTEIVLTSLYLYHLGGSWQSIASISFSVFRFFWSCTTRIHQLIRNKDPLALEKIQFQ